MCRLCQNVEYDEKTATVEGVGEKNEIKEEKIGKISHYFLFFTDKFEKGPANPVLNFLIDPLFIHSYILQVDVLWLFSSSKKKCCS